MVKGEGFAVDASVMEADASRYHGQAPDEIDWSLPERQTRAVAEFLSALDDEDPQADRKLPKVISPVDPCSAWTAKANKRVQFGYGLNYLIDIENAVIVDVEATPARTYDEVAATKMMIDRTEDDGAQAEPACGRHSLGTGKFLGWLVGPGSRLTSRCGTIVNARTAPLTLRLRLRPGAQHLYLPQGKLLRTTDRVHDGSTLLYRATKRDCDTCPLKAGAPRTDRNARSARPA